MGSQTGSGDDWDVECSDEEKYDPTKQGNGVWEPTPDDIVDIYTKLSNGENITLEWKPPSLGRRSPTPERVEEVKEEVQCKEEEPQDEETTGPTEFDFDDPVAETKIMTPMRTPGLSKTPRSAQRKVARLDKIMDDMLRFKKTPRPQDKGTPRVNKDISDDTNVSSPLIAPQSTETKTEDAPSSDIEATENIAPKLQTVPEEQTTESSSDVTRTPPPSAAQTTVAPSITDTPVRPKTEDMQPKTLT